MRNIEKLLQRKRGEQFTFAQIKEWFFEDDFEMTYTSLVRATRNINKFLDDYQSSEHPLTYLATAKCGHMGGKSISMKKNKKVYNCKYIAIDFPVVVAGKWRANNTLDMIAVQKEAMECAVMNQRVIQHSTEDVIRLLPVTLETALTQFVVNAKDEYFRKIGYHSTEEELEDFRARNKHRVFDYTYKIKLESEEREKGRAQRRESRDYRQRKQETVLKSMINPEISLSRSALKATSTEVILEVLKNYGF